MRKFYFFPLMILLLTIVAGTNLAAQCHCENCPQFMPDNFSESFPIKVEGATNPTLGQQGQGVCRVNISFDHEYVGDLQMALYNPSGQSVLLVNPIGFFGSTDGTTWDIAFLPCNQATQPAPGFQGVYNNNQAWGLSNHITGTYHPNIGCLEGLTGPVNGTWALRIVDGQAMDVGNINDFSITFCDPSGIACSEGCAASAGNLPQADVSKCAHDPALALLLPPTYSTGELPMPPAGQYAYNYVVGDLALGGSIKAILQTPNLSNLDSGTYLVCGLSYLASDQNFLPAPGSTTIAALSAQLSGDTPPFCGDLTDNCVQVNIITAGCPHCNTYHDCYVDNDRDGFGTGEYLLRCDACPPGYAEAGGDCNDANANANPAHTEICGNETDDDCDGLSDEPLLGLIDFVTHPATCFGGNNGNVLAIYSCANCPGPTTAAVAYQWSNGATGNIIEGLAAGNYTVTVSNISTRCSIVGSTSVGQPAPVSVTEVLTAHKNSKCYGDSTGVLMVSAQGGTGSYYYYKWSNGKKTTKISRLRVGTYTVTVTDAVGCTGTLTLTVSGPASPLSVSVTNISGPNTAGKYKASVAGAGGTPPYRYRREPAANPTAPLTWGTNPIFSQLTPGTYTFFVRDAHFCTSSIVAQIPPLDLELPAQDRKMPTDDLRDFGLSISPNPTQSVLQVILLRQTELHGDLVVRDALGRVLLRQSVNLREGEALSVPLVDWPRGTYSLQVRDEQGKQVVRFFVVER